MADGGWGHGGPVGTGIYEVLLAYVTQGGQLFGARRWADNPLTLTHVRWQGPAGTLRDAFRQPGGDVGASPEEREVWVQLALHVTPGPPGVAGAESPWLPLHVDPAMATGWVNLLKVRLGSRASEPYGRRESPARSPSTSAAGSYGGFNPGVSGLTGYGEGGRMSPASGPRDGQGGSAPQPGMPPPYDRSGMMPPIARSTTPPALGGSVPGYGAVPQQFSQSWQRESPEIVALPCVEVELPPMPDSQPGAEYRREFARDVAVHFGRAARAIPEVSEVKGWMRGDRLVLAARYVVGIGTRGPTGPEMERVARVLAEALAQRTLPYTRMTFADAGEWMQGAPLPD